MISAAEQPGVSCEEIGELRGWTRSTINRCAAEGRARLRELDGDHDGIACEDLPCPCSGNAQRPAHRVETKGWFVRLTSLLL